MKKLLSTLIISLMIIGLTKAQVIFNPATFVGDLPAGMSIVDVGGTKYLQVVLDGWNSNLKIPAFTIGSAKAAKCQIKYSIGSTTTTTADHINAVVQLMDTVNLVHPSWDPAAWVPSNVGLAKKPAPASLAAVSGTFDAAMATIHNIQFFGQEDVTWGPTTGDTIWVGAITTYDPTVLFDPATFTGTLPAGASIESIGGKSYLKIPVDGWNTTMAIDAFGMGEANSFNFEAKVDPGTSGFTNADLNIFVQPADASFTDKFSIGALSTADFTTYKSDAKKGFTVTQIQFACQHNSGDWNAVAGAIIYIGKISVTIEAAKPAAPKAKYDVTYLPLEEYVSADGIIDADEFWSKITNVGNIDKQALPANEDPKITDSKGTFKAAWDADYLYLLIQADDNTPTPNDGLGTGFKAWENDGAEIFLDMKDRRFVGQKRIADEQHQLRFNLGRETADIGGITFPDSLTDTFTETAVWGQVTGGNGWNLELQLPWVNLCRGAIAVDKIAAFAIDSIKAGKTIAWEISIIDAKQKDVRTSIMNWANDTKQDQAYNTNEFYGQLKLVGGSDAVNTLTKNSLAVYPSLANDIVHVKLAGLRTVELYDITGKLVGLKQNVHGDITDINVNNLISGIYFVRASNGANSFVQKVVKR